MQPTRIAPISYLPYCNSLEKDEQGSSENHGCIRMSMLYVLKPRKDLILRSVSGTLQAAGITPNMVTAAGLAICVIAGMTCAFGHLYAGITIFLIGASLDALDGSFARACGLTSEFGRYFDSVCDRLSELAFIAGAVIGGVSPWALIILAGSVLLLASRIYNHRRGLDSNAAMFGRPERLALLITGLLCPAPFNTVIFLTAGFLCFISSGQVLASGMRRSGAQLKKNLM